MHQHATLEDTVYFWVGLNNTGGSGADLDSGTLDFDVRLGGAAAAAIPTLSGTGTLLSHANYPAGCYEIAVAATAANGFAAGSTYAVFATGLVDSQNPTGFVGSFTLAPVPANVIQWLGTAPLALSSQQVQAVVPATQKVDVETIKSKTVTVDAGGTTFPASVGTSTLAAGAEMDLVDAPNSTAVAAIGAALEAMILDEGDATALLAAIAAKVEEFLVNEGDATATLAAIAAAVWANAARTLTANTNLNDLDAAAVQAAVQAAIEANNLDHLLKTATAAADMTSEVVDGSILSRILANGDTSAFDPSTDGLQPVRDRGDAAWITATGFGTLDAAGVRTAIGMAAANLDTQLGTLSTFNASSDKVYLGDGAHGGSSGTLTLSSLTVINAAGTAVTFRSTGGDGNGLDLWGHGVGYGMYVKASKYPATYQVTGVDVDAMCIRLVNVNGYGIYCEGVTTSKFTNLFNYYAGVGFDSSTDTLEDIRDAIDDIAPGGAGSGTGSNAVTITVDDGSNPVEGAQVWVTTDAAGTNTVASGYTNTSGQLVVYLDDGTYYVWKQYGGYTFTNPETMTVAG